MNGGIAPVSGGRALRLAGSCLITTCLQDRLSWRLDAGGR